MIQPMPSCDTQQVSWEFWQTLIRQEKVRVKGFTTLQHITYQDDVGREKRIHPLKINYFASAVRFCFSMLGNDVNCPVSVATVRQFRLLFRETGLGYMWTTQGVHDGKTVQTTVP